MMQRVWPVVLLLFFSGACSLIYQIAWMRELRLVFGSSTASVAAVTAIFMAGLGLGNAVLGARVDRSPNPMRFYAMLELLTVLTVAISPGLIDLTTSLYIATGGQSSLGVAGATAARLLLSVVVLGVPTFLMGGTLPATCRAVTIGTDVQRRRVALLYGLNTLGAVVGVGLSSFWMLETFGTRTTLWYACVLNLVGGCGAYLLSRQVPQSRRKAATASASGKRDQAAAQDKKNLEASQRDTMSGALPAGLIFAMAGIVGFAFFLMELVWYRVLGPILGGTTFTFGIILMIALLGIGLGSAMYHLFFRGITPTLRIFGLTCGLEAALIALPYALGDRIAVLAQILQDMEAFGFTGLVLSWAVVAGIVILPTAFISGLQFPLMIALVGRAEKNVGREVGIVFACNTTGAILGSLAGGFGLLPLLTASGAWILVVVMLSLVALATLFISYQREGKTPRLAIAGLAILLALFLVRAQGPTAAWRHGSVGAGRANMRYSPNGIRQWRNNYQRLVILDAEGVEVSVGVFCTEGLSFIVNGKSDGNATGDADTQVMLGLVGAMLHDSPESCLVVGLGTGESAGWLAQVPSVKTVDVVELEPAIAQVAYLCSSVNHDVMNNPKVNIIYNDAREVLKTSPKQYDLIAAEPSNPYRAGIASLFTREHYAAVRNRLDEDGIFLQWLQAYEVDAQTVGTVLATLSAEFPHVELWQTNPSDLLLVCSNKPLRYPIDVLRRRVAEEPFRSALKLTWKTSSVEGFLARYVASDKFVRDVAALSSTQINTDDKNLIEYAFARTLGRATGLTVDRLRKDAIVRGEHRPPVTAGEVDWIQVEDERISSGVEHGSVSQYSIHTPDQAYRARALLSYAKGDITNAIAFWNEQSQKPDSPVEWTVLGHALAGQGSDEAIPILDQLESFNQSEARSLRALLLWRQDKIQESADQLVVLFGELRQDPWPRMKVIKHAFALASDMASKDPALARRLYEALALDGHFATYRFESLRQTALIKIGPLLEIRQQVELAESFEPHVPWTIDFLKMRSEAYSQTGHPLAAQAQQDLLQFHRNEPGGSADPGAH